MDRREFARLLALGGAAPFVTPEPTWARAAKLPPTPASPDEKFWMSVRDQFVMPKELTMLNAANLCPSSGPVLETMYRLTKDIDQDLSQDNRAKLGDGRENTRKLLAEFLRVTPEEIVITRNTSESNNLVSTGIDLKAGDEVHQHERSRRSGPASSARLSPHFHDTHADVERTVAAVEKYMATVV